MSLEEQIEQKDEQIAALKTVKSQLEIDKSQLEIDKSQLEFELAQLKRLVYGSKSEKFKSSEVPAEQLNLFADPSQEQTVVEATEQITYERKKKSNHKGRNELPSHLPVKEIVIEPEEDTTDMVKIGTLISETLDYTPASLIKVVTIRPKYIAKEATCEEGNVNFIVAPMPWRPIDKAIAESGLLAHLIVSKFIDHLPFYRQIQRFKRDFRWEPSKSTVNDWFIAICTLLEPLYELMVKKLLKSSLLEVDESTIPVQDRSKKGKTHRGYQWVYYALELGIVVFQYHRSRSIQAPKEFLSNYKGWIQCDGYTVYDKLAIVYKDIRLAGCWVHARRGFDKSLDSDPILSKKALEIFSKIYKHERICKDYTSIERHTYRMKHTYPLTQELKTWIDEQSIKVLPKSPIGKAMTYCINQWPKLMACFEDGRLPLDNNLIENKIRPLALGRKNYLFAGSHDAAQRIAMIYSFFATCKVHNVNPLEWLTHVLNNIQETKMHQLHTLLPQNFKM